MLKRHFRFHYSEKQNTESQLRLNERSPWKISQRPTTKGASEQINAQVKIFAAVEFEQGSPHLAYHNKQKHFTLLLRRDFTPVFYFIQKPVI